MIVNFIQDLSTWGALIMLALLMGITAFFQWAFRHRRVTTDESMINYVQMIALFYGLLLGLVAVGLWQRQDDSEKNTVDESDQVRIVSDLARSVPGNKTTLSDALGDYVQSVTKKEWPMMLSGQQRELYMASPELDNVRVAIMQFEPKTSTEQAAVQEMLSHYEQMLADRQRRLMDSQFSLPAVLKMTLLIGALFIWACTFFIQSGHPLSQFVLSSMTIGYLFLVIYLILVLEHPFIGSWRVDFTPYERVLEMLH
jgi:hypothetical protein